MAQDNLRDTYLRGITLGGQDEVIYEETDSLRIARAFRKAGRAIFSVIQVINCRKTLTDGGVMLHVGADHKDGGCRFQQAVKGLELVQPSGVY